MHGGGGFLLFEDLPAWGTACYREVQATASYTHGGWVYPGQRGGCHAVPGGSSALCCSVACR
jgi:hypothetical protein